MTTSQMYTQIFRREGPQTPYPRSEHWQTLYFYIFENETFTEIQLKDIM